MIIVLRKGTEQQDIDALTHMIVNQGVSVNSIVGTELPLFGLIGYTRKLDETQLDCYF